jgi:hypothetical protein
VDFVRPPRDLRAQLVAGKGHYDSVVQAVLAAEVSVWIALRGECPAPLDGLVPRAVTEGLARGRRRVS